MRIRSANQVPACFKDVKCPYPEAKSAQSIYGNVNYSLLGPTNGEVVICFHGLNGSRTMFQDLENFLAARNYRVLSFDLFGHGLSNAPRVDMCSSCCQSSSSSSFCGGPRARYDMDFFVQQTEELLELLGLNSLPLNLIGFSLGGSIAVAYARKHPSKVLRLVAMSPAGFIPTVPTLYYFLKALSCCLIPAAPHLLCKCFYKKERFTRSFQKNNQDVPEEVALTLWSRFVWQLYVKRGTASASLAIMNRVPWFNMEPLFKEVGRHQRPVLLIWGSSDVLNPPAATAEKVRDCFENVKLVIVAGSGHTVMSDKPRQVALQIFAFLRLPPTSRMDQADIAEDVGMRLLLEAKDAQKIKEQGDAAERGAQMPLPQMLGQSKDHPNTNLRSL